MRLAELQQALQTVNPAAVLVTPRVLERVIEQVHDLPTFVWEVPHRRSCVVDRQVLFRHIEQEDLDLNPGQLLPSTVILLDRPSTETLSSLSREILLVEYWRRLFHACVHHELEKRQVDGLLSLDDVRARIAAIGQSEFAEAHNVLGDENYLVPNAAEDAVYIEFVAVFLELRFFAPNLLPIFFPAIRDPHHVEGILAQDVDAPLLLRALDCLGPPDPQPATDTSSDESHDFFKRLLRSAERAAATGNTVRAAILRIRAARVAPGNLTHRTRADAEMELQRLTRRLEAALELTPAEGAEWARHLIELLDRADQGQQPVEADILFDVQKACIDHEKEIYSVSLVDWMLSAGKRPIKRQLPSQRLVRVGNHIQSARQRLTRARLSDASRKHLLRLMDSALHKSEERLRTHLRPVLEAALLDVGLQATNPPERTAFQKIIEEILDRVIAHGFLTFGDLRDTLSRNQLKLQDLSDPRSFVSGDPLLRLDRRLGALLDGVYRPAEIYLRGLEKFTSLFFGTENGRMVTRFFALPFGGSFFFIAFILVLVHLFTPRPAQLGLGAAVGALGWKAARTVPEPVLPGFLGWPLFLILLIGLGFFILGLMTRPALRERCQELAAAFGQRLHFVFVDWPSRILRQETFVAFVRSWPFQLFYRCLLTPTLICLVLWRLHQVFFDSITAGLITFGVVTALVNTSLGRTFGDALMQVVLKFIDLLRAGLLPGLFQLIVNIFKQVVDALEYVLFSVDEWLRFRSGEGRFQLLVRILASALWFPISYFIRFYVVVLIEPGFNPIKAPVSYLMAKVLAPVTWPMVPALTHYLEPAIGSWTAWAVSALTIWFLPDAFGFLFWELKENWKLYRANRPATLRPVMIGSHGETLRGMLEPGFHSGTIPRLYARLRRAERLASHTGTWQTARYYRHELNQVEETLKLFVTRDFINLVRQSRAWAEQGLHVGKVDLACSRVRVELIHDAHAENPTWLEFEERQGWIVAGIPERGWLDQLPEASLRPLNTGLASLYKMAGVDVARERARAALPPQGREFDLTPRALVAWQDHRHGKPVYYDLKSRADLLTPMTSDGNPVEAWPAVDALELLYSRLPLTWEQWVDCWREDQEGKEHPRLVSMGREVLLLGRSIPSIGVELRRTASSLNGEAAGGQLTPAALVRTQE